MSDINPAALFFIAFCTVGAALFGAPLIGAFVGLGAILASTFLGDV